MTTKITPIVKLVLHSRPDHPAGHLITDESGYVKIARIKELTYAIELVHRFNAYNHAENLRAIIKESLAQLTQAFINYEASIQKKEG